MNHSFNEFHILFAIADALDIHNGRATRNHLARIFSDRLDVLDASGNRFRLPVIEAALDTCRRFKAGEFKEDE